MTPAERAIIEQAAWANGVTTNDIMSQRTERRIVLARCDAIRALVKARGWMGAGWIAKTLGCSYTTVKTHAKGQCSCDKFRRAAA